MPLFLTCLLFSLLFVVFPLFVFLSLFVCSFAVDDDDDKEQNSTNQFRLTSAFSSLQLCCFLFVACLSVCCFLFVCVLISLCLFIIFSLFVGLFFAIDERPLIKPKEGLPLLVDSLRPPTRSSNYSDNACTFWHRCIKCKHKYIK